MIDHVIGAYSLAIGIGSVLYGVGREGIRTAEDVAEEREQREELDADWDASAALPGYLSALGIPSIADLRPSHLDALIQLAAGHARDLHAVGWLLDRYPAEAPLITSSAQRMTVLLALRVLFAFAPGSEALLLAMEIDN